MDTKRNNDDGGSSAAELEQRIGKPKRWLREIEHARQNNKKWLDEAKEAYRIYNGDKKSEFNIFYSTIETLKTAVYNKSPKPDIRGRNVGDDGKLYRDAADVLENALLYHLDDDSGIYYNDMMDACSLDYRITGFATCRLDYDFTERMHPVYNIPEVTSEIINIKHVPYERFLMQQGRTWGQLEWICYVDYLNKDEFLKTFKRVPEGVNFDYVDGDYKGDSDEGNDAFFNRAVVYEIWHKPSRKIFFLTKDVDEFLAINDDKYGLPDFFNCPRPLINLAKNTNLEPLSLYSVIKQTLNQINVVVQRINHIVTMIKAVGAYDGNNKELAKILKTQNDGEMIPVQGLDLLEGRTGFNSKIWLLPIDAFKNVLSELRVHLESLKQQIYEVTGISDIIRGASNASETATAQNIKGNFATMRIDSQRERVASFNVGILRIASRMIAAKFSTNTMRLMSGIDVTSELENLLRDSNLLNFSINIESDSTTAMDREQQQQSYTMLLKELGAYLTGMLELYGTSQQLGLQGVVTPEFVQGTLSPIPALFKMPRQAEDAIRNMGQNIQPMQQPMMGSVAPMQQPMEQQQQIMPNEIAQDVINPQQQVLL